MNYVTVALPYNLKREDLNLEPSSVNYPGSIIGAIKNADKFGITRDEWPRILTAAVLLYHNLKGSEDDDPALFAQCLDTAIIWERG